MIDDDSNAEVIFRRPEADAAFNSFSRQRHPWERVENDSVNVKWSGTLFEFSTAVGSYIWLPHVYALVRNTSLSLLINKILFPFAEANGTIASSEALAIKISLDSEASDQYFHVTRIFDQLMFGVDRASTTLISDLIVSFDAHLKSLVSIVLLEKPEFLNESGISLDAKTIMSLGDIETGRGIIRDKYIERIVRTHNETFSFMEEKLKIEFRSKYRRYVDLIEIIERRNIVVHNNGIVNAEYLSRCSQAGVKLNGIVVGSKLDVSASYMDTAACVVLDAGFSLALACWQKTAKGEMEDISLIANEAAYLLMKSGAFKAAAWIIEGVLDRFGKRISIQMRQSLRLNLANCYKKLANKKAFIAELAKEQWQSSTELMRLCYAALKEDESETSRRVATVRQADDFKFSYFVRWMIFDWVRDTPWFQEAVNAAYGRYPIPKEGVSITNIAAALAPTAEG